MSKLMVRLMFAGFLVGGIALNPLFSGPVGAEEAAKEKASTESATKANKTRGYGADTNIKSKAMSNDPKAETPAPPNKGGKTHGYGEGYCGLHVDNRTPWVIGIYVDGDPVGTVSRWGDATGTYSEGAHTLYAVAEFTDGSRLTFGPRSMYCGGPYIWTLNP